MEFFNQLSPAWQMTIVATIKVVGVMAVLLPMIAYSVMAERRVSALIQDRVDRTASGPLACCSRWRTD